MARARVTAPWVLRSLDRPWRASLMEPSSRPAPLPMAVWAQRQDSQRLAWPAEMAASAARLAAGQLSDCQAGTFGDFELAPAAVEELLPVAPLPWEETPMPEAAGPVVLVRLAFVPVARRLVLFFEVGDWPAPVPAPLGLLVVGAVLVVRAELLGSVGLPAPGRRSGPL